MLDSVLLMHYIMVVIHILETWFAIVVKTSFKLKKEFFIVKRYCIKILFYELGMNNYLLSLNIVLKCIVSIKQKIVA